MIPRAVTALSSIDRYDSRNENDHANALLYLAKIHTVQELTDTLPIFRVASVELFQTWQFRPEIALPVSRGFQQVDFDEMLLLQPGSLKVFD